MNSIENLFYNIEKRKKFYKNDFIISNKEFQSGERLANQLQTWLELINDLDSRSIEGAGEAIKNFFKKIGEGIMKFINFIIGLFKKFGQWISNIFKKKVSETKVTVTKSDGTKTEMTPEEYENFKRGGSPEHFNNVNKKMKKAEELLNEFHSVKHSISRASSIDQLKSYMKDIKTINVKYKNLIDNNEIDKDSSQILTKYMNEKELENIYDKTLKILEEKLKIQREESAKYYKEEAELFRKKYDSTLTNIENAFNLDSTRMNKFDLQFLEKDINDFSQAYKEEYSKNGQIGGVIEDKFHPDNLKKRLEVKRKEYEKALTDKAAKLEKQKNMDQYYQIKISIPSIAIYGNDLDYYLRLIIHSFGTTYNDMTYLLMDNVVNNVQSQDKNFSPSLSNNFSKHLTGKIDIYDTELKSLSFHIENIEKDIDKITESEKTINVFSKLYPEMKNQIQIIGENFTKMINERLSNQRSKISGLKIENIQDLLNLDKKSLSETIFEKQSITERKECTVGEVINIAKNTFIKNVFNSEKTLKDIQKDLEQLSSSLDKDLKLINGTIKNLDIISSSLKKGLSMLKKQETRINKSEKYAKYTPPSLYFNLIISLEQKRYRLINNVLQVLQKVIDLKQNAFKDWLELKDSTISSVVKAKIDFSKKNNVSVNEMEYN